MSQHHSRTHLLHGNSLVLEPLLANNESKDSRCVLGSSYEQVCPTEVEDSFITRSVGALSHLQGQDDACLPLSCSLPFSCSPFRSFLPWQLHCP